MYAVVNDRNFRPANVLAIAQAFAGSPLQLFALADNEEIVSGDDWVINAKTPHNTALDFQNTHREQSLLCCWQALNGAIAHPSRLFACGIPSRWYFGILHLIIPVN